MIQGLRLCASIAGGTGSTPGWGAKTPQAMQSGQERKKESSPGHGINYTWM